LIKSLRLTSGLNNILASSGPSRKQITMLQLVMSCPSFERFLLHSLRSPLSLLNEEEILLTESISLVFYPTILNSLEDINVLYPKVLKSVFLLWDLVLIAILHGIWSEVILASGSTSEFGKSRVQLGEVKNQSSCSRSGSECMLLQVYFLPFSGNSIRSRWSMVSLKTIVSLRFPPGLLRSSRDL
jgi:hypothetical protein